MNQGLAAVDWLVLAGYAGLTLWLGWFYGRRQSSTSEYFLGGGRLHPVAVGVSLFATLVSTVSYLSVPGETLGRGPVLLVQLLALPVVYFVVAYGLLPVYMKHRVTSAYELLEVRLGAGARLLGASMFIVLRLAWMSLLVYAAAVAMTVMIGAGPSAVPLIALCTAVVAVVYTSLGGLRAVVVTDCIQSTLLLAAALLVVGIVTLELGGFEWFPTTWHANWDSQPLFSTNPATRVTVFGTLMSTLVWYTATAGGDQVSVQRFMATTGLRAARRAYRTQLAAITVVTLVLALVGFALLGYFEAHPERLGEAMSLRGDADQVFPFFIGHQLPPGISGLVVAAMFAAAMSSVDSGVNSISAVVLTDFLGRFRARPRDDASKLGLARWLAAATGGVIVLGSSLMYLVPGNITEVTSKTSNLLTAPIFGLFLFALFIPQVRPVGANRGHRSRYRRGRARRVLRTHLRSPCRDRRRPGELPVDCSGGARGSGRRRLGGEHRVRAPLVAYPRSLGVDQKRMARTLAAIGLLGFQIAMIGYARFVPSRYFCWAPMDSQNLYSITVVIDGRELDPEAIEARYRQPAKGGNWQAVQHVLDKVRQYEQTYGRDESARVVVAFTVNGGPEETWTWPPP